MAGIERDHTPNQAGMSRTRMKRVGVRYDVRQIPDFRPAPREGRAGTKFNEGGGGVP
jgi:hypothetical protein